MRSQLRERVCRAFAALAAAAVVAGCGGSGHPHAAPTTTTINPDVVPPVITPAYINAVFVQLNHVYGNAVRELVATHQVNKQVLADLRAIYADPQYGYEVNAFHVGISEINQAKESPGDPVFAIKSLDRTTSRCVEATVSIDTTAITDQSNIPPTAYIVLVSRSTHNDSSQINSTAWLIDYEKDGPPPKAEACENT